MRPYKHLLVERKAAGFATVVLMSAHPIPAWNGRDLLEPLVLAVLTPTTVRTCCGDANCNGRAFGGQVLAQALIRGGYDLGISKAFGSHC